MVNDDSHYVEALKNSHLGVIHKYASLGDGVYSFWDYSDKHVYLQSNYFAGFPAEVMIPFSKISDVHKISALPEVAKQRLVFKQFAHIGSVWKDGAWREPLVDIGVEGVLGLLARKYMGDPAKYRIVPQEEYKNFHLAPPDSKHRGGRAVVEIIDDFWLKYISFLVGVCELAYKKLIAAQAQNPQSAQRTQHLSCDLTFYFLNSL